MGGEVLFGGVVVAPHCVNNEAEKPINNTRQGKTPLLARARLSFRSLFPSKRYPKNATSKNHGIQATPPSSEAGNIEGSGGFGGDTPKANATESKCASSSPPDEGDQPRQPLSRTGIAAARTVASAKHACRPRLRPKVKVDLDPMEIDFIRSLPVRPDSSFSEGSRDMLLPRERPLCQRPIASRRGGGFGGGARAGSLLPKKTLVLDLDETLVSSTQTPCPCDFKIVFTLNPDKKSAAEAGGGGGGGIQAGARSGGREEEGDAAVDVSSLSQKVSYYIRLRPGLDRFLANATTDYELVVWTASGRVYADAVLDVLDPGRDIFSVRLYRGSCVRHLGLSVKDLRRLGRPMSDVILLDNYVYSFGYTLDNGMPIHPWTGHEGPHELGLSSVSFLLAKLARLSDVRPGLMEAFDLHRLVHGKPSSLDNMSVEDTPMVHQSHSHSPPVRRGVDKLQGNTKFYHHHETCRRSSKDLLWQPRVTMEDTFPAPVDGGNMFRSGHDGHDGDRVVSGESGHNGRDGDRVVSGESGHRGSRWARPGLERSVSDGVLLSSDWPGMIHDGEKGSSVPQRRASLNGQLPSLDHQNGGLGMRMGGLRRTASSGFRPKRRRPGTRRRMLQLRGTPAARGNVAQPPSGRRSLVLSTFSSAPGALGAKKIDVETPAELTVRSTPVSPVAGRGEGLGGEVVVVDEPAAGPGSAVEGKQ